MKRQRSFSPEFKRQVVEELLSDQSRPAQVCRRYEISSTLAYTWKRQCAWGKFDNGPTEEVALRDRVEKLERLVGKLILENEFPRRQLWNSLAQAERNGRGCRLMKLARSSFYYKPEVKDLEELKKQADGRDGIEAICLGFHRCMGVGG